MLTNYVVIDVATAPIPDAAIHLEGSVKPPANYKDEAKIADYIREKEAERLAMAATDVDLARITGIGLGGTEVETPGAWLCRTEDDERSVLGMVAVLVRKANLVTYGGFNFDLPLLMRRARYLDVEFPTLNLDRYRSPHIDLCEVLSDRNPQRKRPLGFYVKRLGWPLVKPLSGQEEARVHETGEWDRLAESLSHDLQATQKLAEWCGLVVPVAERQHDPAQVF